MSNSDNNIEFFSSQEISDFKKEIESLFRSHSLDQNLIEMILNQFQFDLALNHDANLFSWEIIKFMKGNLMKDQDDLFQAIIKGTITFNYKAKIGEFLSTVNK